ncbi:MAG: PaaI family thioesterase [Anaerolineales bacterium]|nr:PaaI family thioesterase [Anaerolineales bacterium]
MLLSSIVDLLHKKLGDRIENYLIPPPVFITMQGEFLDFDLEKGSLTTRFPVLKENLNPYGSMQGGMVAAAVDNTFGPLSMLVASENVTRRLEVKYSRPITLDLEHIIVEARLLERKGRRLIFSADVRNASGELMARARALHWIVEGESPTSASFSGSE